MVARALALLDEQAARRVALGGIRVVAHGRDELGVVARGQPALDRRQRDGVTRPGQELLHGHDLADRRLAPAHRVVRPVEELEEGFDVERRVVGDAQLLGTGQQLDGLALGGLGRLAQAERRRRASAGPWPRRRASASATRRWASLPYGSACWVLDVRVRASVSWRVHSRRLRMALAGSLTIWRPSSMLLARTTSSSAVRSGTRAISRRYSRMPSSISREASSAASLLRGRGRLRATGRPQRHPRPPGSRRRRPSGRRRPGWRPRWDRSSW